MIETNVHIMTYANTLSFPPLNKEKRAKAKAYIKKYEKQSYEFVSDMKKPS